MKTIAIILIALLPVLRISAQQTSIPDVDLRDIDGNIISSSQITQPGTATMVVFWKSSSGKCCENLETLQEAWQETLKHKGVRLVAICVDCNGSWTQVKPIVNGNSWDFDTYIDVNGDFKRAMNVGDVPCTMLFDEDQNMICRYNSACTGSQEFICANIMDHLNTPVTAPDYEASK
ncbi:MAG: TlpA family protein disulfide reductase [Bacteroidales bacterium]|jgi:peroxiredoxin|nr:TlpA family protein disulfide reductase [Bacteroidales bacterium]